MPRLLYILFAVIASIFFQHTGAATASTVVKGSACYEAAVTDSTRQIPSVSHNNRTNLPVTAKIRVKALHYDFAELPPAFTGYNISVAHTIRAKNYIYSTRFFSHRCCAHQRRGPPMTA